ncbi:hypothetical protein D9615_000933 [Tricholomella constricta]|uniref:MATE efflux family protein n=1 Tax=Tricholomella constricta TaxID=117010 RepID=A0A8H5HKT8_9AGAR|nr:hypothetical protein D9615_000933 [Tricholomella constricta]
MASQSATLSETSQLDVHGWDTTETTSLLPPWDNDSELSILKSTDASSLRATMFWEEMRTIPRYALPVFGSQILEFSMMFISVISIGHLSTMTLAAVSLGSMTANVTGLSVLQGLASALDTLLPSAYTSPQPQLVAVVMAFAVGPIALVWFSAEAILLALKQDLEVAHLAAVYLRWLSLGLPAFAYNCISRRYFQSQGLFFVQTRIISFVAPVNVVVNYLLVWGPKPIRLGFIGAPIASVLSFYLISLISFIHVMYFTPRTTWHPLSAKMFTNLGLLVRLGLSGIAQLVSEWWGWEFAVLAASFMGPITLASQSILTTTAAMAFQLSFAIANATSIRIGNLLGEKNATRAGVAAYTSLVVEKYVLPCTILVILRNSWATLFNNDPEVVKVVAAVIPLIALFQIVDSNAAVTQGILRARGKQFIGALLNLSAYYVIGLPLGVWLAFRRDLGLNGLWIGLTTTLVYNSAIGTILCFKTDWNEEVVRVVKRLAEEERLRKVADEENRPLSGR